MPYTHNADREFAEGKRLVFELDKQITTLSAGALVLLTTFRKDLPIDPQDLWLLGTALTCFAGAISCSVLAMGLMAVIFMQRPPTKLIVNLHMLWGVLGGGFFVAGMAVLLLSALRSLY
jgi:hypothetical protein